MSTLPSRTFQLTANGTGVITWQAPDGKDYKLNPADAKPGEWLFGTAKDESYKEVMAYITQPGENYPGDDGVLVVSLEGASGGGSMLMHAEDDWADRVYYSATDGGTDNPLNRHAFILRASGIADSPIKPNTGFRVLNVGVLPDVA